MKEKLVNKIKLQLPTIIAVLLTLTILVGSFLWFSRHTNEMIASTTEFYLETNARSQAAAFNTKLDNLTDLLVARTNAFQHVDLNDREAVVAMLKRIGMPKGFQYLAVAGPNGELIDEKNSNSRTVANAPYFKAALEGKTTISDIVLSTASFGEYLYIVVPIIQNDKPAGMMYGQFSLTVLSDLIQMVGFQETSTSLLLSRDGTIIARSATNELVTSRISNFYDLGSAWGINGDMTVNDVKVDVLNSKTITLPYQTGSRERLAILTPVGINNWYYAIVISQDIIHKQSDTLSYNLLFVELMITFAFIFLFISILHLIHNMSLVQETNERFKMASAQANAIVFDYDFKKEQLQLTGGVDFIESDAQEHYNIKEIREKARTLLHESDLSVIHDLSNLAVQNENHIHEEMRLLCADGNYYWYRCTATVIRNENGELLRLVGNLMNVEDEVSKQQKLKQKAEIDPLSGLLNKGAFTSYVKELLENSDATENLYAFYIIDLDNFKKVNDTMGHMVGDKVITDVAKKICTVFSENDFVGRIGGDEFTAFLKLSGEGVKIGERIIKGKAEALRVIIDEIYSDGKHSVNVTSSIGISIYPNNGRTFEELYKNADAALYKSKYGGKNQYNLYDDIKDQIKKDD